MISPITPPAVDVAASGRPPVSHGSPSDQSVAFSTVFGALDSQPSKLQSDSSQVGVISLSAITSATAESSPEEQVADREKDSNEQEMPGRQNEKLGEECAVPVLAAIGWMALENAPTLAVQSASPMDDSSSKLLCAPVRPSRLSKQEKASESMAVAAPLFTSLELPVKAKDEQLNLNIGEGQNLDGRATARRDPSKDMELAGVLPPSVCGFSGNAEEIPTAPTPDQPCTGLSGSVGSETGLKYSEMEALVASRPPQLDSKTWQAAEISKMSSQVDSLGLPIHEIATANAGHEGASVANPRVLKKATGIPNQIALTDPNGTASAKHASEMWDNPGEKLDFADGITCPSKGERMVAIDGGTAPASKEKSLSERDVRDGDELKDASVPKAENLTKGQELATNVSLENRPANERADVSSNRPAVIKPAEMMQTILRMEQTIERLKTRDPEHAEIRVALQNGDEVSVKMQMEHGVLKVSFRSESTGLVQALEQGWNSFAQDQSGRESRAEATSATRSEALETGLKDFSQTPDRGSEKQFESRERARPALPSSAFSEKSLLKKLPAPHPSDALPRLERSESNFSNYA